MSNLKNYIELTYTPDGYTITIITDYNKETKLNRYNAKIMFETLKKYQEQEKNGEVYIFTNIVPILINFYIARKKADKRKRVNRTKSRNVAVGSVLAVTLTLTIGGLVYTHNSEKSPSSVEGTIASNISTEFDTNNIFDSNIDFNTLLEENNKNANLESKTDVEDFHYYDYRIGDKEALENAKEFDEIFEKYEKRYGIDKNLLRAIAAQESSGNQSATNGSAYGLMGIENVWTNQKIEVYNFETERYEEIIVDYEKVKQDAEYCIKIGTAIMQQGFYATLNSGLVTDYEKNVSGLISSHEVLAYATQRYNMGGNRMQGILQSGVHWMEGRKKEEQGDPEYFENVFSRLENGTIIEIQMPNGKSLSFSLTNDALELESTHNKN